MEDISVQLTLTGEEIEQLAEVTGYDIEDKEDLTQAILMAIEKYVKTYKKEGTMKTMYEVDLRSRLTGKSVTCIYSGDNYDKACEIADNWNKKCLADYDKDTGFDDYIDFKTDGVSACVYVIMNKANLHGVGTF